jgi:thiamine biosynthesis lipoprotein
VWSGKTSSSTISVDAIDVGVEVNDRQRANALIGWIILMCLSLTACDIGKESREVTPLTGSVMGTQYLIKVIDLPEDLTLVRLDEDVNRLLQGVDAKMSTYRDDSELSRFNAAKTTEWVPVSDELIDVVDHARQVSELTDGAFDITVGPLVNLWGFGPDQRPDRVPTDKQIATAKTRLGYQQVHTRRQPPALKKDRDDIYLDLSALAKGYAVDQVADYLEKLGITDYMVEVGGELRLKGRNENGTPWRIAVERPTPGDRDVYSIMELEDMGVATSGDYRNYFEQDGKRYSHTIDPRTGRPIDHTLASITVIADTSMHADALATALMVVGPDEGDRLAKQHGIAAYFIVKSSEGFDANATRPFEQFLVSNN